MRLHISYLASLICLLALSGCIKDLDVTPADENAFLAEEFYSSPESYLQGLAGVYANLSLTGLQGPGSSNIAGIDAGFSQYGRGLWTLQELPTDEVKWSWENDPGMAEIQRHTWTAGNVLLRGMYGRGMAGVAFANEYLRQTADDKLDSRGVSGQLREDIQLYRAEARFLRALYYYHLMDLFGKAAFVTEETAVGAFQAPQADREMLFEFIESELLDIESQLKAPLQNEYGRADKGAAWMLLAKIYLNAEVYVGSDRYADCLDYCQRILDADYELSPEYLELFMADNDANAGRREIIFPLISDGVVTQNYGPTTVIINGQVGSKEANGEDFGIAAGGWGGALRVPQEFTNTFLDGPYENDDRNTLIINEDRSPILSSIADRQTGYIVGKFSNLRSDGGRGSDLGLVDTDFPLFRLGDVYLMYAEAHLRGGGGSRDQALALVNALRERADNPERVNDLTLELLLDERMVELYWEAHRRQDLIRYGLFTGNRYNWAWKGNAPNGVAIGEFRKVYPLPGESLAANPNLTQNPGY